MKQSLSLIKMGCLAILLLTTNAAFSSEEEEHESASMPTYYPNYFPKQGLLTEIRSQFHWVVDGVQITVSSNVLVHTLVSNFASLYSIQQGMELGYRKNADGEIAEIWQLPNGTIPGE